MEKREIDKRILVACVGITNAAKRTLKEEEGVIIEEVQDHLNSKFGQNFQLEEITSIFENAIKEGMIGRGELGKYHLTKRGVLYAKDKKTKEAMRLVLLGEYTM